MELEARPRSARGLPRAVVVGPLERVYGLDSSCMLQRGTLADGEERTFVLASMPDDSNREGTATSVIGMTERPRDIDFCSSMYHKRVFYSMRDMLRDDFGAHGINLSFRGLVRFNKDSASIEIFCMNGNAPPSESEWEGIAKSARAAFGDRFRDWEIRCYGKEPLPSQCIQLRRPGPDYSLPGA
jgi:hypothetical protein